MQVNHIYKICFSATGTTSKTVSALADTLSAKLSSPVLSYDFTLPAARESFPELMPQDLVLFGMPTYAGRLPNLMLKYLDEFLAGNGALAVPVVTFGNRNFDNSLIELRDILESHCFHTVAGAACSCEHSFSYKLGAGRPDASDLAEIGAFAEKIAEKVTAAEYTELTAAPIPVPGIPAGENYGGYYQPRDRCGVSIDIRKVKPLTDMDKCTRCGICAQICPMGAIDVSDVSRIPGICIKCGGCIKKCPKGARYYDDPGYLYHKTELEEMYVRRAENTFCL